MVSLMVERESGRLGGGRDQGSLWGQIQAHLPPAEVDPVRRAIGLALVDKNEGLLRELEALDEILQDLQDVPDQVS